MINPDTPRISAANLTLKRPAREPAHDPVFELSADTQAGGNKNDSALALITACIEEGIDTRPHIVDTLGRLGWNTQHVALMLKHNAGPNRVAKHWRLDPAGALPSAQLTIELALQRR